MKHALEADWQQYFPTYQLGEKDIALAEYDAASERARSDDSAISIANGLLVAAFLPVIPAVTPFLKEFLSKPPLISERLTNFSVFILALMFATSIAVAYFCHLRRSYVFSSRKVIVLRRMLGQSYGPTTLILPNWRIEGADNPLSIRLFPGWHLQICYPYYAIAALAATVAAYGFSISATEILISIGAPLLRSGIRVAHLATVAFWLLWFLASLIYVRRNLFDHHETGLLSFTRILAALFRFRLQNGTQSVLYGARLARYEAIRLKLDLTHAKKFAILREDRRFLRHKGNDFKAIARALKARLKGRKVGGGTTITQQLARTLFIKDLSKTYRRKFFEIMLAWWLESLLTKQEIIEIYLCCVRYERGVLGIAKAKLYFFPWQEIDKINSVVLVERISSVTGKFRREAIAIMLEKMVMSGVLQATEAIEVLELYSSLIAQNKVVPGEDGTPEDIIAEFRVQFQQYG